MLLFPIGLLFIIPWVSMSKRVTRISLSQVGDGTVERKFLFDKPVAASTPPTTAALAPAKPLSDAPTARFMRWVGAKPLRIAGLVIVVLLALWALSALSELLTGGR